MITEYCEGGDFEKRIENNTFLKEIDHINTFVEIANGCKYLAQKGIIHRDLKPANILMKGKTPKIADFGFATTENNKELLNINAGSPLYMAPEALAKK